jgi:hypothetical protein
VARLLGFELRIVTYVPMTLGVSSI